MWMHHYAQVPKCWALKPVSHSGQTVWLQHHVVLMGPKRLFQLSFPIRQRWQNSGYMFLSITALCQMTRFHCLNFSQSVWQHLESLEELNHYIILFPLKLAECKTSAAQPMEVSAAFLGLFRALPPTLDPDPSIYPRVMLLVANVALCRWLQGEMSTRLQRWRDFTSF